MRLEAWKAARCIALVGAAALGGCASMPAAQRGPSNDLPKIETDLAAHISVLASDAFAGREPGTDGEGKTLDYLRGQWEAAGLQGGTNNPANPWLAPVDIAVNTPATSTLRFTRRDKSVAVPDNSAIVYSSGQRALLDNAPLLFVGKEWEDLESAELTGRVAVMLWDHPQQREQREALLAKGASAVLAILGNESQMAPLTALRKRGSYRLADDDEGSLLDGLLTPVAAEALLGNARLTQLREAANSDDFRPVPLGTSVSMEATATAGTVASHNLIARLPGTRPAAGAVLLLAHWDHFGVCAPPMAGDRICNGAVDNASGLAVLTELARRLAAGPALDRDVYLLATTGEEWGLLGARAFADDPPLPLESIVAAFNIDSIAVAKRGGPVAIVGEGLTTLDAPIRSIIAKQGRAIGDETLAAGFVRRQDGWVLLQRDIPTLMVSSAFADRGPLDRYTRNHYHQPSDESTGIELGGAAQDLLLHLGLVQYFANVATYPGAIASGDKAAGD